MTKKKAASEAYPKTKTTQATKGKRIKSSSKGDKSAKKKQLAETSMDKGLTVLSDAALTEAEQLKLVIERSKTQTHNSHASGSGADKGTGDIPGVPDVPTYGSDEEQISWKSSEEDDEDEVNVIEKDDDNDNNDDDDDADNQDDENPNEENHDDDADEQTDFDNDGDDFVHPKFSTHDDEARQEEVNEEDIFDLRVQTPSHVQSTDDESNEEVQGTNIEEENMVEEATHEEDEANKLYMDVKVNLEGKDTVMMDASLPNVQATHETEDTHVILTALINPEGQQQSFYVSSGFVTTCSNPIPRYSKRTNLLKQFFPFPAFDALPVPNKMNDAIKTVVQLQSNRLREEAQAKNEDFLNKLDDNIKKIIKEQVKEQVKAQVSKILPKIEKIVNEQLEAEVMTRSSTESKTSLAIAANLSELELKKILIEKMKSNKSINKSNEQKNLYKALVEAYESDKLILDTYGDTVSFKRRRDNEDKDEEPSTGSNQGSKRRGAGKEPESTSASKEKTSKTTSKSTDGSKSQHKSAGESAHTKDPMHVDKDLEEPAHQEFDIGATEEQSDEETSQHPD
ncbi:hypothetical protein Tco_0884343 [Tanacetum coccineum]